MMRRQRDGQFGWGGMSTFLFILFYGKQAKNLFLGLVVDVLGITFHK